MAKGKTGDKKIRNYFLAGATSAALFPAITETPVAGYLPHHAVGTVIPHGTFSFIGIHGGLVLHVGAAAILGHAFLAVAGIFALLIVAKLMSNLFKAGKNMYNEHIKKQAEAARLKQEEKLDKRDQKSFKKFDEQSLSASKRVSRAKDDTEKGWLTKKSTRFETYERKIGKLEDRLETLKQSLKTQNFLGPNAKQLKEEAFNNVKTLQGQVDALKKSYHSELSETSAKAIKDVSKGKVNAGDLKLLMDAERKLTAQLNDPNQPPLTPGEAKTLQSLRNTLTTVDSQVTSKGISFDSRGTLGSAASRIGALPANDIASRNTAAVKTGAKAQVLHLGDLHPSGTPATGAARDELGRY